MGSNCQTLGNVIPKCFLSLLQEFPFELPNLSDWDLVDKDYGTYRVLTGINKDGYLYVERNSSQDERFEITTFDFLSRHYSHFGFTSFLDSAHDPMVEVCHIVFDLASSEVTKKVEKRGIFPISFDRIGDIHSYSASVSMYEEDCSLDFPEREFRYLWNDLSCTPKSRMEMEAMMDYSAGNIIGVINGLSFQEDMNPSSSVLEQLDQFLCSTQEKTFQLEKESKR